MLDNSFEFSHNDSTVALVTPTSPNTAPQTPSKLPRMLSCLGDTPEQAKSPNHQVSFENK